MNKIAMFASGSGTNAQNIANYFKNNKDIVIDCVLSNNPKAFVLKRFENTDIETFVFDRDEFNNTQNVLNLLKKREIDFIVLAGFLWLVPDYLTKEFKKKIVNIHPALLPKYGGKGMYGMNVHKAVVDAKETESGITIHYVNEQYDEGDIIFQAQCKIEEGDTPEIVAQKVHELEYEHFPKIIEQVLLL
jgi:phosphoribosylglycinamide formyltransferase 1